MKSLAHRDCVKIERNADCAKLVLYDSTLIKTFNNSWTDEQIIEALDFVNINFEKAYRMGKIDKENEIKKVLNL